MLKVVNYSHLAQTILLILLAIIIDQCTKIFISKIMLDNGFASISVFSFFKLVFVRLKIYTPVNKKIEVRKGF